MLARASRISDWRLSFIPHIFGNLYLWLILFEIQLSISSILLLLFSLLTSFGFAALGYFINEYFDIKHDYIAGKINRLSNISNTQKISLLFVILSSCLIPWLYLPYNKISIILIIGQITLFCAYAMPPLRLKLNTWLAPIIDSLYAYIIPLLLSYYTYYLFTANTASHLTALILVYSILLFIVGLRNIVIHYINDIFKDKAAGLITLPRVLGVKKTNNLLWLFLIAESIISLVFIALASMQYKILLVLVAPYVYIVYRAYSSRKSLSNHLIVNQKTRHLPDAFYQFYAPLCILFALIVKHHNWAILVPMHFFLFIPRFKFHPIKSWFQRINFKLFFIGVKQLASWVVNYTIFFLFLIVGVNLRKEKTSAIKYLKKKLKFNNQ